MSNSEPNDHAESIHHAVREQLLLLDGGLRVKAASKSFYTTFKVGVDQTVGKPLAGLGSGQWSNPALLRLLNEMPKVDGEFDDFEMEYDFPQLGLRTKMVSARRLADNEMESGMILLSIRDITRQKRTETEAGDLLSRFRTTLASIGDAVIVTDPESHITFMNPTAERLTGWPQADAMQRHLTDVFSIVNEQSSRTVENPVDKAIRMGAIVGLANHTILIARDGTEWPIDDSAAPILDAKGNMIGVVLVFHDITDRRKVEHELEISEIRYRRLFESAHDGILILDANTAKILDANRFMVDLLGYSREHFLGKELWEIGVFKDAETSKTAMAALQKSGNIRYEDLPLEHKSGRQVPVEFISNVYREGRRSVIQCNIRDIGKRKLVENELAKAKETAEAANRSKSEFLANMSHEIRTPMNAILGFADMVVHKHQDKEARIECAQIIHRNAVHLLELINEILDLSKIEALQMKVERLACDLPEFLSEIIALMRPRAEEKGLGFAVTFTGAIPRMIQTDPLRLRQILVNLLGNAVKFTKSGKIDLRVSAQKTEETRNILSFDVIDSGIGMEPQQLTRLFRPFTQGDESITRKYGGTGLGLTISRRLAELLHGNISVTSEVGIGSKFTLNVDGGPTTGAELLQHLTEATLPLQAPAKPSQSIAIRGRILLVEDVLDNQRLLRLQLRDAGAVVVTADDGKAAVDLATTQPFDLILMDMQMPIMDGYAATAELRRKGLKIPIIAFTASAMAEDRARCLESGCDDYLSKPANEEILLKSVNQHLGIGRASAPDENASAATADLGASRGAADDSTPIKSSLRNTQMRPIIAEYVGGLPAAVQKLNDLLVSNDLAELQKILHQLRGTGGGYGFDSITETATRAEESIKAGATLESIIPQVRLLIDGIRRIDGYQDSQEPIAAGEAIK